MTAPIIVWFRQDLRRTDNPALYYAYEQGRPVIPVYILDDENAGDHAMGAASCVWLHHSLTALDESLNGHLSVFKGKADEILPEIVKQTGADSVHWNRCYEPWRIKRDKQIKSDLEQRDIEINTYNAALLWEPWTIRNQSGEPYKVFTPFYKKGCLQAPEPAEPLPAPDRLTYGEKPSEAATINDLGLLPDIDWYSKMLKDWTIGEDGADRQLNDFLENGLSNYKEGRNLPGQRYVSRMSPHLHHGEISPRQIWHSVRAYGAAHDIPQKEVENYCSELGWREFSYHLLYHFPTLPDEDFQEKFNDFPWQKLSDKDIERWQQGQTGYPIVDAAMRELWQTGYMHNRCRMIVGSFLVKDLLAYWPEGEKWFWDCLFDADLASNSASWQWIAGCGADAAPYFRIFNPILQSKKFDENGDYIRAYVPELKDLPDKHLHEPWDAPEDELDKAGVRLGETYPRPMVDHFEAKDRALAAYNEIKGS